MQSPPDSPPPRSALLAWLAERGHSADRLVELSGDVSPRRYLRVELARGGRAVAACYPQAMRSTCRRFVETTALLEGAGVPVPRILAADCDAGLMLLEDAGETTLFDRATDRWTELTPFFEAAIEHAGAIAGLDPQRVAALNPPLDEALLGRELEQTWDLFLAPRGLTGSGAEGRALRRGLEELCQRLGAGPRVPCHRDFMARNLVPHPTRGLLVLDHQDLRLGPPEYDLASLLNDSLFPPTELETRCLGAALGAAGERRGYQRAAAQRTLKAVGTFQAFARRGFERHLALVPTTLGRALRHLLELPETAAAVRRLEHRWLPLCAPAAAG